MQVQATGERQKKQGQNCSGTEKKMQTGFEACQIWRNLKHSVSQDCSDPLSLQNKGVCGKDAASHF